MNFDDVRAVFSVVMFALLISIYIWAWSKNRKQDFNEAANLPFNEPEKPAPDTSLNTSKNTSGEKV
ncbi:hypothetical protein MNBD_GAMMA23-386 [hydrothermal vent metagenome]|uniref:Cytochrome c oxidase subunit CcoQ n=1 Tax=hydrothermal vent metagenome TaxID=652676 RepID=A0A3B0ZG81_9ZZZZ